MTQVSDRLDDLQTRIANVLAMHEARSRDDYLIYCACGTAATSSHAFAWHQAECLLAELDPAVNVTTSAPVDSPFAEIEFNHVFNEEVHLAGINEPAVDRYVTGQYVKWLNSLPKQVTYTITDTVDTEG